MFESMTKAAERLSGMDLETIRTSALCNCIKKETMNSYASQCRRLYKWHLLLAANPPANGRYPLTFRVVEPSVEGMPVEQLLVRAGREITKEDFFAFCNSHAGFERIPFKAVRAALRFAQIMADAPEVWAASECAISAEKSAIRTSELLRDTKPKGTLSPAMFLDLIEEATAAQPNLVKPIMVQMGACLRFHELAGIKARHVSAEGVLIVDAKRDRANRATGTGVTASVKILVGWAEGCKALHILLELKGTAPTPDSLLFPRSLVDQKKLNAFIRQCAIKKKWPAGLLFNGSHILRHAGVRRAVIEGMKAGETLDAMAKKLHMSIRTVLHYALSNDERTKKVNIPLFLVHLPELHQLPEGFMDASDSDGEEDELPRVTTRVADTSPSIRRAALPAQKSRGSAASSFVTGTRSQTLVVGPTERERRAARREEEAALRQLAFVKNRSDRLRL